MNKRKNFYHMFSEETIRPKRRLGFATFVIYLVLGYGMTEDLLLIMMMNDVLIIDMMILSLILGSTSYIVKYTYS